MKRRTKFILLIVIAFVGLFILLYPIISNLWNNYRNERLETEYSHIVSQVDNTDWEKQKEAANIYNRSLIGSEVPDAFSIREDIQDAEYEAILKTTADGIMGFVEIPKIEVNIPIYHYTTEESLEKGAGHLFGSSIPIGGPSTHTVLSAHRGLPGAKLFTDLNLIEKGDYFYLHILNDILAYEVDDIRTVDPTETDSLAIEIGQDLATLVTCTPYAVNTHRILVRGHRVEMTAEEAQSFIEKSEKKSNTTLLLMNLLCMAGGIVVAWITVFLIIRWRKQKSDDQSRIVVEELFEEDLVDCEVDDTGKSE